jgi:hypothetical protein
MGLAGRQDRGRQSAEFILEHAVAHRILNAADRVLEDRVPLAILEPDGHPRLRLAEAGIDGGQHPGALRNSCSLPMPRRRAGDAVAFVSRRH